MYKSFFHVCLLLPFCLAISSCNDSGDDAHVESSVTMGLIFPLSVPKGKPRHHAALLAVQHLAEAGYPIQRVVADSKLDRFLGVEAARRLVENGAKVLIGASSSSVTMEIADWVSVPNQIPQISYASTSPEITDLNDNDFLFRTVPSDKLQGAVLAHLAKEKGYDNVAVIYRRGSYGENLSSIFQEEFQARGGIILIDAKPHAAYSHSDFDEKISDIENEFERIFNDLPDELDAIVAISYKDDSDFYVKQAFKQDKFQKTDFIFVDGNKGVSIFTDENEFDKSKLDGMCGTFPGLPDYTGSLDDPRLIFEDNYFNVFLKDDFQEEKKRKRQKDEH